MKYFMLIHILPPDLVHKIYKIILKDNATNIIIYKFRDIKLKKNNISEIICSVLYNGQIYNNKTKIKLLLFPETINKLEFIVNNRFSRLYNRTFWLHLLSEMSAILMHMHNEICMHNKSAYSKEYYENLKKTILLWFKLCQNHNIKLKVYYRDIKFRKVNKSHIILCKHKKKINNFHCFLYPPLVLDNEDNVILDDRENSKNILESYLEI